MIDYQAINEQAKIFFDDKQFIKALELFKSVSDLPLELIPNLAKCYYYTSQADKALNLLLPLEKCEEMWIDIALYNTALGRHKEAFEIYKGLDQNFSKVQFNIGWHYLRNGEFKKGFDNIQHGDKCRVWGHEFIHIENGTLNKSKRWNNQQTDHLIYILEGGLGDEIIFLRWANYLKTKCNKLTVVCSPSLLRLFTNAGYNCVPNYILPRLEHTHYAPAMSLPAICGFDSPQDHVSLPYIKSFSEPFLTKQIDQLADGKMKIGVRWRGNPEFEHDQFRNPPKSEILKLNKYGQLFSLQIDEDEDIIPNCKHLIKDWQDTYSIFTSLDILVTSCTSTAHLAGAMGIRAIVIVPIVPYFVWASDDLLWYGNNITVIRQTKYNDWADVIESLNNELSKFCSI